MSSLKRIDQDNCHNQGYLNKEKDTLYNQRFDNDYGYNNTGFNDKKNMSNASNFEDQS